MGTKEKVVFVGNFLAIEFLKAMSAVLRSYPLNKDAEYIKLHNILEMGKYK